MKTPVIVVKQQNLAVLTEFDGIFVDTIMQTRPSIMMDNRIRHAIDSNGDLWSFTFANTNHVGIRKVFSTLIKNISHDQYTYTKEANISVERFREIVEPHQRDLDPDHSEMAIALFESVAACHASDLLRSHIHLLNL